ncbi:MAG TPA: V-type ATPase subunit [Acidimicrobiia bacterium]|nr:V-type ATPase subunit [Acidimicrobiia bacterium]
MTGFEYGNTRLRARKSKLLRSRDYQDLSRAETLEAFFGALADTPYGPDLTVTLPRFRELRILDEALRLNLTRDFREIRGFYSDPERQGIDLILQRWDLHNLRTILRGQARLAPAEEIRPLLVAAGSLDETDLNELAGQSGVRATLDLIQIWGIPSPATARELLEARPAYEKTADPLVLECAVDHAFASHVDEALTTMDSISGHAIDPDLESFMRSEIDLINLLTALRLREARLSGEGDWELSEPQQQFLPAGRLTSTTLDRAWHEDDAQRLVADLTSGGLSRHWLEAMDDWTRHGNLVHLSEALDLASTTNAVGLFGRGDPLSFAVPIAYIRAKETEIRNLRLIGRAIAAGWDPITIEDQLVVTQ